MRVMAGASLAVITLAGSSAPAAATDTEALAVPDEALVFAEEIYRWASSTSDCQVPWTILSGVAAFASDHGRVGGASAIGNDGQAVPAIVGPELNGSPGLDRVEDTDGGELDGNAAFDHAVGPFQFLPTTWDKWARDGNGDGVADAQNAWDAATAAAALLCDAGVATTPRDALDRYFGGSVFTDDVLRRSEAVVPVAPDRRVSRVEEVIGRRPLLPAAIQREGSSAEGSASNDVVAAVEKTLVGDWNGDGEDTIATLTNNGSERTASFVDSEGRPYGHRFTLSAEGTVLAGDWDGDGVDTLAVAMDGPSGAAVALDRLGAPDPTIALEIGAGHGPLVVRLATDLVAPSAGTAALTDLALIESDEVRYLGPALAHGGATLELWRVRGITVEAHVAPQLHALLLAAEADGIALSGWGFRSHEQQIVLRASHCADVWESLASSCSPPTAKPGTSRHEFGVAVDFTQNGSVLTRASTGFAWMQEFAADYGFINLPSEPWHWSVDGG